MHDLLMRLQDLPSWEWPADAATTLVTALRDEHATEPDLLLATELAGDLAVMDDAVAAALLALIEKPDEFQRVRAQAAIALGPALEQASDEGFDQALSDPPISEPMFTKVQQTQNDFPSGSRLTVRRESLFANGAPPG